MANVFLQILFFILFLYFDTNKLGFCHGGSNASCVEVERKALLEFKSGLSDPSGRLSSWIGENCCQWRGVSCSPKTKHVTSLNLRNPISNDARYKIALRGNISSSLLDLKFLTHFDLSMNNFSGNQIPNFFGFLQNLRYLNLSGALFYGSIPQSLRNLSNLEYLDLNYYFFPFRLESDLQWLSGLSSLKHLNLEGIDLSGASSYWLQAINTLPSLLELHLPWCDLQHLPPSLPFVNFTSLSVLDISGNYFNSNIPQWLFNLSGLRQLDLSQNSLQGAIPRSLGKLCNLKELVLSYNSITGDIAEITDSLLECPKSNLERLDLYYNKLTGLIPKTIGNFSSLKELGVGFNQMSGNSTKNLGQLSSVVTLRLSGDQSEGIITEAHLMNLSSLQELSVDGGFSPNTSLAFNISSDWDPPFKLTSIYIDSVRLGPKFSKWLKNQTELTQVTLTKAGIAGNIPDWFTSLNLQLGLLDLSGNELSGEVPNSLRFTVDSAVDLNLNKFSGPCPVLSSNVTWLSMSHNSFSGPIPPDISTRMPNLWYLDISNNFLDGSIPLSLGNMTELRTLFISNNRLSGEIPQMPFLGILFLSNNSLTGTIPSSIASLGFLRILGLSGNSLSGELPLSLRNCSRMEFLDLGDNQLSGNLPTWLVESMPSLSILRLRNNSFTGTIPLQLCSLPSLHFLDLSKNNLSGPIPPCVGYLSGFKSIPKGYIEGWSLQVVTKGSMLFYREALGFLMNSIDLSENNLDGEIPANITTLSRLDTLNLSRNHITGKIPSDIGSLKLLESLDLSVNQLSGPIPSSMASLTLLNHLNLSHNNLSGYIPTSNQFQTFNDPSIYLGNAALCGKPLTTKCGDETPIPNRNEEKEDNVEEDDVELENLKLFAVGGLGFILGFWGVCGTLIIRKRWRDAYFYFLERTKCKICEVFVSN